MAAPAARKKLSYNGGRYFQSQLIRRGTTETKEFYLWRMLVLAVDMPEMFYVMKDYKWINDREKTSTTGSEFEFLLSSETFREYAGNDVSPLVRKRLFRHSLHKEQNIREQVLECARQIDNHVNVQFRNEYHMNEASSMNTSITAYVRFKAIETDNLFNVALRKLNEFHDEILVKNKKTRVSTAAKNNEFPEFERQFRASDEYRRVVEMPGHSFARTLAHLDFFRALTSAIAGIGKTFDGASIENFITATRIANSYYIYGDNRVATRDAISEEGRELLVVWFMRLFENSDAVVATLRPAYPITDESFFKELRNVWLEAENATIFGRVVAAELGGPKTPNVVSWTSAEKTEQKGLAPRREQPNPIVKVRRPVAIVEDVRPPSPAPDVRQPNQDAPVKRKAGRPATKTPEEKKKEAAERVRWQRALKKAEKAGTPLPVHPSDKKRAELAKRSAADIVVEERAAKIRDAVPEDAFGDADYSFGGAEDIQIVSEGQLEPAPAAAAAGPLDQDAFIDGIHDAYYERMLGPDMFHADDMVYPQADRNKIIAHLNNLAVLELEHRSPVTDDFVARRFIPKGSIVKELHGNVQPAPFAGDPGTIYVGFAGSKQMIDPQPRLNPGVDGNVSVDLVNDISTGGLHVRAYLLANRDISEKSALFISPDYFLYDPPEFQYAPPSPSQFVPNWGSSSSAAGDFPWQ